MYAAAVIGEDGHHLNYYVLEQQAKLCNAKKQYTDAIEKLNAAIKIAPQYGLSFLYELNGDIYLLRNKSGDLQRATDAYTQSIQFSEEQFILEVLCSFCIRLPH
jgi:tetratricopeptide (TPR) repeat protein